MVEALLEIAAHLRQADLVPGGVLYEDVVQKARLGPTQAGRALMMDIRWIGPGAATRFPW
jgi:hypothetical protein